MKTTERGRLAESAVANLLEKQGYKVIDKNWRTRLCEIDIVASKGHAVYFVEVKYRASPAQGDGFEYITAKKMDQMRFAADNWIAQHDWDGDYFLMAAAATGLNAEHIELVEL